MIGRRRCIERPSIRYSIPNLDKRSVLSRSYWLSLLLINLFFSFCFNLQSFPSSTFALLSLALPLSTIASSLPQLHSLSANYLTVCPFLRFHTLIFNSIHCSILVRSTFTPLLLVTVTCYSADV